MRWGRGLVLETDAAQPLCCLLGLVANSSDGRARERESLGIGSHESSSCHDVIIQPHMVWQTNLLDLPLATAVRFGCGQVS